MDLTSAVVSAAVRNLFIYSKDSRENHLPSVSMCWLATGVAMHVMSNQHSL